MNLLDKDFKSTILIIVVTKEKHGQKLKKITKTMFHQRKYQWRDRNYKKQPNRNSGIEEYI